MNKIYIEYKGHQKTELSILFIKNYINGNRLSYVYTSHNIEGYIMERVLTIDFTDIIDMVVLIEAKYQDEPFAKIATEIVNQFHTYCSYLATEKK